MKKILSIISVIILLVVGIAVPVSAKDTKKSETVVFTVNPGMSCQNCENKIKSNLRFEKGVSDIQTSLKDQTVTVTFDPNKTNLEKITAAFKKIGYEATVGASGNKSCTGTCCDSNKK